MEVGAGSGGWAAEVGGGAGMMGGSGMGMGGGVMGGGGSGGGGMGGGGNMGGGSYEEEAEGDMEMGLYHDGKHSDGSEDEVTKMGMRKASTWFIEPDSFIKNFPVWCENEARNNPRDVCAGLVK